MARVLVADDERGICDAFSQWLVSDGHEAVIASSGEQALAQIEQVVPDVVFLDVRMPGMGGLKALEAMRRLAPDLPVIVMTAHGTVDTAMEAVKLGAFDYLGKPVELAAMRALLTRALHRPTADPARDAEPLDDAQDGELIGRSAAMQEVFKLMGLLTANDLTVLITGESGVGKELVARGIHAHGDRRDHPFVAVNCAAIPAGLIESELFGHEKGAFTDADRARAGRIETAAGGTLFLDEISELDLPLQGRLLRVLQERVYERVGGDQPRPVRARLIAATNRPLEREVAAGRFREDLYHRLDLVNLRVPPLRKRKADIEPLARHFLALANRVLKRKLTGIEPAVIDALERHGWPGNVRELENTIKRSALAARGPALTVHDVRIKAADVVTPTDPRALDALETAARAALRSVLDTDDEQPSPYQHLVERVERALVDEAMTLTGGNQAAAAKLLKLHRTTLRKRLRQD